MTLERMSAASEVFRLVTGVPLNAESRMGATVDLTVPSSPLICS